MKFKHLKNTRPLDFFFIIILITAIILTGVYAFNQKSESVYVKITSPAGTWIYPLEKNITISIPGKLGNTVVEIKDGFVSILSSPCPNKTCVKSKHIRKQSQWLACLPNKVMIYIEGNNDSTPIMQ